jgi:hypothetical protein
MDHAEHREEIHVDHPHSFDQSEPKAGFIALFGLGTVVTLALTAFLIQFYWEQSREQKLYEQVLAPEGVQLKEQRAREDQALGSYGYADRTTNKVRVPIQRAMDLMVQEAAQGKHSWPTTPYRLKTPEELAGGGAGTNTAPNAQPAAQGPGLAQGNQSNDPSAAKPNH